MEIVLAVRLQVVAPANAGIGLNRNAATRLIRGASITIAARTVGTAAVEGVVAVELVAYFVRDIIDVKSIRNGIRRAG